MTDFLEKIKQHAQAQPDAVFYELYKESGETVSLTWGELWNKAVRLASWMDENLKTSTPVVIYGHKDPIMIVSFIGSLLSGRGYCPVDISVPADRVKGIIDNLSPELIVCAGEEYDSEKSLSFTKLTEITAGGKENIAPEKSISGSDVCYIIYTSGSTGTPKGVQITGECLDNFIHWGMTLGSGIGERPVFLNQAPFSFDLSVMDLYLSLYSGGKLHVLPKKVQGDMKMLMESLKVSGANIWVSTPSFAEVCLSDECFGKELLPDAHDDCFRYPPPARFPQAVRYPDG